VNDDRPLCECHGQPLRKQRNADGTYRLRCMVESEARRRAQRADGAPERTRSRDDHASLDALRWQRPELDADELRAELERQRALARSGALEPA
jgi:hypothetical protein